MTQRKKLPVKASYTRSVFINCPFDEPFKPLFQALIFTIQYCGFAARCALELDDSGEARATKIVRLIKESQFGIHDISRTELTNNLPRFNMPYELGLFIGLKVSEDSVQQKKRVLILDKEAYRYQQFISDIAGQDIRSHEDDPQKLIQQVRHWLQNQSKKRSLLGAEKLWQRFTAFQTEIPVILIKLHKSEADLNNYVDFHNVVNVWISGNPPPQ